MILNPGPAALDPTFGNALYKLREWVSAISTLSDLTASMRSAARSVSPRTPRGAPLTGPVAASPYGPKPRFLAFINAQLHAR